MYNFPFIHLDKKIYPFFSIFNDFNAFNKESLLRGHKDIILNFQQRYHNLNIYAQFNYPFQFNGCKSFEVGILILIFPYADTKLF